MHKIEAEGELCAPLSIPSEFCGGADTRDRPTPILIARERCNEKGEKESLLGERATFVRARLRVASPLRGRI
jgi:hypothetical protein